LHSNVVLFCNTLSLDMCESNCLSRFTSVTPLWNDHQTNKVLVSFLALVIGMRLVHTHGIVNIKSSSKHVGDSEEKTSRLDCFFLLLSIAPPVKLNYMHCM